MPKNRLTTSESIILDEYYRLWLLLTQARSAIFKLRHKKVGQYLHPNQAAALVSIWALNGKITPAILARRLFLEPHTVSELIIRMEKKGLVTKKRDRKNATVVRIKMTKKGRDVCQKVMGQELIHQIMSRLSDEQRVQLNTILEILFREAIKQLGQEDEIVSLP